MLKFLIVVTGYNWEQYVKPCFDSIKAQTYREFTVAIVNDGSTDGSLDKIISESERGWTKIQFPKNRGTFWSRKEAITACEDSYDIIALLDGDDQLLPNALEIVAKHYEVYPDTLMTYGNYQMQDGTICPIDINYPEQIRQTREFRSDTFRCTHLRTFRKGLYNMVPFWIPTKAERESYPDAELLFSMMEMAGPNRIGVVQEPIYIYTTNNPLRTLKRFGKDQSGYSEIISRPKRELLS